MWFLDGRHVFDVIANKRPPPISYREWLLCDLKPEAAGPMGARLRKLYEITADANSAYTLDDADVRRGARGSPAR